MPEDRLPPGVQETLDRIDQAIEMIAALADPQQRRAHADKIIPCLERMLAVVEDLHEVKVEA